METSMILSVGDDEKGRESKIKPDIEALVERNFAEGKSTALAHAHRESEESFWPIGLCIAWVLKRGRSPAVEVYAHHRLWMGVRQIEGWAGARTELIRALQAGRVTAIGICIESGKRAPLRAMDWLDLRVIQRGPYDEVCGPDVRGKYSLAYRDVRIATEQMREQWVERPIETTDAACLQWLKTLMTDRPKPRENDTKAALRREFPAVSERKFDSLFAQAARETGFSAWSRGGRRPRAKH
jgi:hypothetical protein